MNKTSSPIERQHPSKGHGSPKDGDHDKMMLTYDDLVVDHLIAQAGSPVGVQSAGSPDSKDKDGVYKIFCSSLRDNKEQNQFWNSAINDTQDKDQSQQNFRGGEDISPATQTLSKNDGTTSKSPKVKSFTNANNRSERSKSVVSKEFAENNIPAKQIVIFDSQNKDIAWTINKDLLAEMPSHRQSEQRLSKPMTAMEENKDIEQEMQPKAPTLLVKNEKRVPLDQKVVLSINRGSDSATVNSFQNQPSNSVMLKAQWHMGPVLRNKRGSGIEISQNHERLVSITNSHRQKSAEPNKQKLEWKDSQHVFSTKTRSSGQRNTSKKTKFKHQVLKQPVQPILTMIKNRKSLGKVPEDEKNHEITSNMTDNRQGQKSALKTQEFFMPYEKSQKTAIRSPYQAPNVKKMQATKLQSPSKPTIRHDQYTPEKFFLPMQNLQHKTDFSPHESHNMVMSTSKSAAEDIQEEELTTSKGYQPVRLSRFYKEQQVRLSHPIISIAQVLEQAGKHPMPVEMQQVEEINLQQVQMAVVAEENMQLHTQHHEEWTGEENNGKAIIKIDKNGTGPPFQLQMELPQEEGTSEANSPRSQRSLICLVKKRADNLSPRYNKKQNKSSEDLRDVLHVKPLKKNKNRSSLQDNILAQYGSLREVETERAQQNYIQSVGEYLNSHRSSENEGIYGEDNGAQTRFEEYQTTDKISLLSSLGSLDPSAQKVILMAVLKAKIQHLSNVQNPFKVAQQPLVGKNITMFASSTYLPAYQNIKPLQLTSKDFSASKLQPPTSKFCHSHRINTQFQQPNFKRSQQMIAPLNSNKKSPYQTAEEKEKLYRLLEKCLNDKKIEPEKNEQVLELLLALEKHDEWAFKNKGKLSEEQSSESRNKILQALLNIFMRLQEEETENQVPGKNILKLPQNHLILTSHHPPHTDTYTNAHPTKNIATAINMSTFERESIVVMKDSENKQTMIQNLGSTQQFPSQGQLCNSPPKLVTVQESNFCTKFLVTNENDSNKEYSTPVMRQHTLIRPSTTKARAYGLPQNADLPQAILESSKSLNRAINCNMPMFTSSENVFYQNQNQGEKRLNNPSVAQTEISGLVLDPNARNSTILATTPLGGVNRRVLVHHRSGANLTTLSKDKKQKQGNVNQSPDRYSNNLSPKHKQRDDTEQLKVSEEESSASSYSVTPNISAPFNKGNTSPHTQSHVLIVPPNKKRINTPLDRAGTLSETKTPKLSAAKMSQNPTPLSAVDSPEKPPSMMQLHQQINQITIGHSTADNKNEPTQSFKGVAEQNKDIPKAGFSFRQMPISQTNLNTHAGLMHNRSQVDSSTFMRLRQQRIGAVKKASVQLQQSNGAEEMKEQTPLRKFKSRTFGFRNLQNSSNSKRPATTGASAPRRSLAQQKQEQSKMRHPSQKRQSGQGNFSIINLQQQHQEKIRKNSQVSETSLNAQPSLVVLASKRQLPQQNFEEGEKQFYLTQHAKSSKNGLQWRQENLRSGLGLSGLNSTSNLVDGGLTTVPSGMSMTKLHEVRHSQPQTGNGVNPVLVMRQARRSKDLRHKSSRSNLQRNLVHIDESSYVNDVTVFTKGNQNYIQVFDQDRQKRKAIEGAGRESTSRNTRVQTRLADSQRSRISRIQQQQSAVQFQPLTSFQSSPRGLENQQMCSMEFAPSSLHMIGSQASMKHRYASDVLFRQSVETHVIPENAYPTYSMVDVNYGQRDLGILDTQYVDQKSEQPVRKQLKIGKSQVRGHIAVPQVMIDSLDRVEQDPDTQRFHENCSPLNAGSDLSVRQSASIPPQLLPLKVVEKRPSQSFQNSQIQKKKNQTQNSANQRPQKVINIDLQ